MEKGLLAIADAINHLAESIGKLGITDLGPHGPLGALGYLAHQVKFGFEDVAMAIGERTDKEGT